MKKILFTLMTLLLLNPLPHATNNQNVINPIVNDPLKTINPDNVPGLYKTEMGLPGNETNLLGTNKVTYSTNTGTGNINIYCSGLTEEQYYFFAFKTNKIFEYNDNEQDGDYLVTMKDGDLTTTSFRVYENDGWNYICAQLAYHSLILPFDESFINTNFYWMLYPYSGSIDNKPSDKCFVNDNVSPVIQLKQGISSIEYNLSEKDSPTIGDKIKESILYSDNFTFKEDLQLYWMHENYDSNTLKIWVKDNAGNTTTKYFPFNYYDDLAPEIKGPDVIYKGTQFLMTFDDIKELYTITDKTNFTSSLYDGDTSGNRKYEGNGNIDGDYVIRLTATDSNSNIGIKIVNIKVYDILAPIAILDTETILVYNNIQLELNDFIQVLKTTKLVDTNYENNYTIIEDTYSDSYLSTGNHKLSILVKSSSGNSFTHEFNIKVVSNAADLSENASKNWIDSVGEFFNSIWLWIWDNVFKPVFKLFGYQDR